MSNQTEQAVVAQGQAVRTITLYATKGGKKEKVETDVTTWKELRKIAKDAGYDVDKLLSTENVTRHDLVNDEALLPEGPFTLFMRPKQVKSGGYTGELSALVYKEIKTGIKEDLDLYGDVAKAHYNEGKNYTTKSTEELRKLLGSFVAPVTDKSAGTEEASEPVVETATEVIEEVAETTPVKVITNADRVQQIGVLLTDIIGNASSQDVKDRTQEILEDILPGLAAEIDEDKDATTTNIADVVESVKESKESAEEEGRRIAREKAEKEETDRIAAEKAAKAEANRLEKEEDDRLAAEAKMFS